MGSLLTTQRIKLDKAEMNTHHYPQEAMKATDETAKRILIATVLVALSTGGGVFVSKYLLHQDLRAIAKSIEASEVAAIKQMSEDDLSHYIAPMTQSVDSQVGNELLPVTEPVAAEIEVPDSHGITGVVSEMSSGGLSVDDMISDLDVSLRTPSGEIQIGRGYIFKLHSGVSVLIVPGVPVGETEVTSAPVGHDTMVSPN